MNSTLRSALYRVCFIGYASETKSARYAGDFYKDKIYQAACEPTLAMFFERLMKLLGSSLEMPSDRAAEMLDIIHAKDAPRVLEWFRQYPTMAAMIIMLKKDDRNNQIGLMTLDEIPENGNDSQAYPYADFDIKINANLVSPLSHGSDTKAGNATMFRTMDVIGQNGNAMTLPFYSGNAVRGKIRDLLADHFLQSIGIEPSRNAPKISLWFFHAIYSGGTLEEDSESAKALKAKLGDNGAQKAQGITAFRNMLPALSALGTAMGNKILSGRANVSDLRPMCFEWGYDTKTRASDLYTWEFLTRRDDYENKEVDDDGNEKKSNNMIAQTQCLKAGTILNGGIDFSAHANELERSALVCGLELLAEKKRLGAENRRGFGMADITANCEVSSKLYRDYLIENKDDVIKYLVEIGAYNACD